MSDVALFDIADVEETWAPVWEPEPADFGWHFGPNSVVLRADGTPIEKAEWSAYLAAGRCRDCGAKCSFGQGGAGDGRSYRICDACALLDGDRLSTHTTTVERRPASSGSFPNMEEAAHCDDCGWWMFTVYWDDDRERVSFTPDEVIDACAEHERPRHGGRWGYTHEIADCERLHRARAERRARYLAERVA